MANERVSDVLTRQRRRRFALRTHDTDNRPGRQRAPSSPTPEDPVSLGSLIKRILGGGQSRDDESDEQEEYGARDRGVADLEGRSADPYGGDNAVAHALEDGFEAPRDPNP
jgi:hypothetical protein